MTKTEQLQIRVTPAQKAALRRGARRAGQSLSAYVLSRALSEASKRFGELVRALRDDDHYRYALAELNDLLTELAPGELVEAVADADIGDLSPLLQNYVAAMVEQVAGQKGVAPPPWVRDVAPLEEPYFAVPFPRLRAYLLRVAPVAFKRRNLFVDAAIGDRV